MVKTFKLPLFLLSFCAFFFLCADDAGAVKAYEKGLAQVKAKDYYDALKSFKDSELLAKSNTIRANSIRAQIGAAKLAGLPWQEFELIETLIARFPEFADVPAAVKRQYELGDLYFRGKREPAFYAMRKIPWLTGPDKTVEIYTRALKRFPFAAEAPSARLRLAFIYDQQGEVMKSIEQLRIVVRDFPNSKSYKLALLALSCGSYELALRGDGDGRYAAECAEISEKFLKRFPGDAAEPMVKRNLQRVRDAQARRLHEMADFYRRQGRSEAAARYLAQVVREFPDSAVAPESENVLAVLDRKFTPGDFPKKEAAPLLQYKVAELPAESERVLFFPGEKGNHNLLPYPDLKEYTGKEVKEK